MTAFLTGGTGYIGRHVVRALVERGTRCTVVSRSGTDHWHDDRVRVIRGDPRTGGAWQEALAGATLVINLAGATIVEPPKWWTDARKRLIRSSRIDTTQRLSETIRGLSSPPSMFVSGSAVGYYGSRGDDLLDEDAGPGEDFLADLCVEWEAAAREVADVTTVLRLRVAPVLGVDSPVFRPMIPPFKLGIGGPWGSGKQWWPWIHVDDVVGLLLHAIDTRAEGALNVVAPGHVTVHDFAKALGHALSRPAVARVPEFVLRMSFGEAADALLASQRVDPARARALGYQFRWPDLEAALREVFAR